MTEAVPLGIVAIGRNEGERLKRCLRTAIGPDRVVVYVDSGSSDGSVTFAKDLGVEVVELDTAQGFTAARARNAGFRRLMQVAPSTEFVQFVDGDCELVDGWLDVARTFLTENPAYAVACGRRRELYPEKNIYHRLTDMEWDTPVGDAKYCGGDAMMRVKTISQAGGYRDSLIAGEEPELCVRLRQHGGKIRRLDAEMTRHDIAMSSWRQWWQRSVRSGHAYAEGAALHGAGPERHWVKERRSVFIWGLTIPAVFCLLAWPTLGWSLVMMLAMYALMISKVAWSAKRRRGLSGPHALIYGVGCLAAKLPQAWGMLAYQADRLSGARSAIIEYKGVIGHTGNCAEEART